MFAVFITILHTMKQITIDIVYENISEIRVDKGKNLIIHFNNGDRITLYKNEYTQKVRKHLIKNFSGEHL